MNLKSRILSGVFAIGSLLSLDASAITLPFTLTGGWMQGTQTQTQPGGQGQVSFIEADGSVPGASHELRWGVPASTGNGQQSGLRIDNEQGFISSDGVPVLLSTLTHFNNIIKSGTSSLTGVMLRSQLELAGLFDSTDIGVSFTETPNVAQCATPTPNGSNCDDFFTFGAALPSFTFVIGNHKYRLDVFLVPGDGVEIIDGVVYTRENGTSQFFTYGRLIEIAEPGTLAMLGLGLLLAGRLRRRI
ncbi:MAG: THxN family PEP-CTERM protein [Gammaproteobacteria bacterium]|nr:THxN family PEP-CTERM protein [Gammaproteobacteria bacterium]